MTGNTGKTKGPTMTMPTTDRHAHFDYIAARIAHPAGSALPAPREAADQPRAAEHTSPDADLGSPETFDRPTASEWLGILTVAAATGAVAYMILRVAAAYI